MSERGQRRWSGGLVHRAFLVGIVLKGCDGLLEMLGGGALLMSSHAEILRFVKFLTHGELIEDPNDFVANLLLRLARHLSVQTKHFASIYLLVHGVIKTGLVAGLWQGLLWSYPAALIFLSLFLIYQIYRLFHTPSLVLGLLTLLDIAIVCLIWFEWRHHERRPTEAMKKEEALKG